MELFADTFARLWLHGKWTGLSLESIIEAVVEEVFSWQGSMEND